MRAAPRRALRALTGLRPRLLAALLLTSAVTLGVAALAVLSPLEARLRADATRNVRTAIAATRQSFSESFEPRTERPEIKCLHEAAARLSKRVGGAQVTILNRNLEVVIAPTVRDLDVPEYYPAAQRALAHGSNQTHITPAGALIVVQRIHIPPESSNHPYALIVVKHLQYVSLAVRVVQNAFIVAAAVGLGTALLLGIAITTTLLRRLERLRSSTRELERSGLEAPLPQDGGRDEIGELSRSFASLQARLRRQEDARRSFVATASHELRTPLASLDGMLELLADDLAGQRPDLQDARLRTDQAREQTARLSQLAADLLDLSRLDSEVPLRTEPLELGELCRAVAAEFERTAARRQVTLAVQAQPGQCWAKADPGAAARIVRILVDNALRYAPPGSAIEISSSRQAGAARVLVADEGPGVPEQDAERIFERFTRGSATAGRGGGFGLGLAIGRELAQRMGGSLALLPHAAPPDHDSPPGARFALRLPFAPDALAGSGDTRPAPRDSLPLRGDERETQ